MKRRTLLSLAGIGFATQTAGCMGNEPAETESDETADQDQSSENVKVEQDAENEENREVEQDTEKEEPIISEEDESETQQQQEQDNGETGEESSTEQDDENEQQDDTDESTADVGDMQVFVEHKEKREVIPGATVIIRHQNDESAQWQGTTETHQGGEHASVVFQAIPTGTYTIFVRADGFTEISETIELIENGLEPTFQLSPAESTILFIVKDQFRDPVPDAAIDITYGISETAMVTTNEQGEARYTAPQQGKYTYSVRADGYQTPTTKETTTVENDTTIRIDIEEDVYRLRVDNGEGNTSVGIERLHDSTTTSKRTDRHGIVDFEVHPGEYEVWSSQGSEFITVPETTSVTLGD